MSGEGPGDGFRWFLSWLGSMGMAILLGVGYVALTMAALWLLWVFLVPIVLIAMAMTKPTPRRLPRDRPRS